jgi:hypothetical protein
VTKKPKGWTEEAWAAKFLKISIATTNRNTMDDDAKARYKMARARIMKERSGRAGHDGDAAATVDIYSFHL